MEFLGGHWGSAGVGGDQWSSVEVVGVIGAPSGLAGLSVQYISIYIYIYIYIYPF